MSPPRSPSHPARGAADSGLRLVQEAIAQRQFAPVYLLVGDDEFLKDAAQRDLLEAAVDAATRDFNCEVRRSAELDAETLGSVLATPPLLAERRAVVLRDVPALRKAARQQLDRYLERPAADTLLLLVAPAGAKVDAGLSSRGVVLHFDPLTPERVRRWIGHHARTVLGATVEEDAAKLLQEGVGNDLQQLAAELDKCASYALAHRPSGMAVPAPELMAISADVVSAVVGVRRGETVSDLLDAVALRDAARATALVGHVLAQPKMAGVPIVMMLATQALALAYGRARRDGGVPTSRLSGEFFAFLKETGAFTGRPWGEAASAWTRVVDRWTAAECDAALRILLEADVALKETMVSSEEGIVTGAVLALCATGRRAGRAA